MDVGVGVGVGVVVVVVVVVGGWLLIRKPTKTHLFSFGAASLAC